MHNTNRSDNSLTLKRQTVRHLTPHQMGAVEGGATTLVWAAARWSSLKCGKVAVKGAVVVGAAIYTIFDD